MEDDIVKISIMIDIYSNLLTEKQLNTINSYYNLDLSLAEIAETEGISRQAVADNIQKAKEKLYYFEENLGLYKKQKEKEKVIDNIIEELDIVLESVTEKDLKDRILKVISKLSNFKK